MVHLIAKDVTCTAGRKGLGWRTHLTSSGTCSCHTEGNPVCLVLSKSFLADCEGHQPQHVDWTPEPALHAGPHRGIRASRQRQLPRQRTWYFTLPSPCSIMTTAIPSNGCSGRTLSRTYASPGPMLVDMALKATLLAIATCIAKKTECKPLACDPQDSSPVPMFGAMLLLCSAAEPTYYIR